MSLDHDQTSLLQTTFRQGSSHCPLHWDVCVILFFILFTGATTEKNWCHNWASKGIRHIITFSCWWIFLDISVSTLKAAIINDVFSFQSKLHVSHCSKLGTSHNSCQSHLNFWTCLNVPFRLKEMTRFLKDATSLLTNLSVHWKRAILSNR